MLNRRLGQYELLYQLGAPSGMGSVYVAQDKDLRREVAVKELLAHLSRDPDFAARFHAEAENLARLSHPNITTLYTLGHEGETEFMVMELIRGHTLKDVMHHAGRLTPRECLAVVAQAAAGLGYAHRMGVIHRDIKPSNLMVTFDGQVKIMDFGISRVRGSERQTRDGGIVGTLLYISPEQLRSDEGDERSDIYSLGVTLYEMLSGKPPFHGVSEYELMRMHLEVPPPPLSSRMPEIDPQLDAAVLRAMAKDPADRYATAGEFSRAIGAAALAGEATEILQQCLARAFDAEATVIHPAPPPSLGGFRPHTASQAPRAEPAPVQAEAEPPTVLVTAPRATTGAVPPSLAEPAPKTGTLAATAAVSARPAASGRRLASVLGLGLVVATLVGGIEVYLHPEWLFSSSNQPTAPVAETKPVQQPETRAPEPIAPAEPQTGQQTGQSHPPAEPVPPPVAQAPAPPPPMATPEPPVPAEPPPANPARVAAPPITAPPRMPSLAATPRQPVSTEAAEPPQATPSRSTPPVEPVPPTPGAPPATPPVVLAGPRPLVPAPAPTAPGAQTEEPSLEGIISAAAGTHALMIGGRIVTLYGIEPNSPNPEQFSRDRIALEKLVRGMAAICYQRPHNRFKCTTRKGEDLAVVALHAGIVRPSQNAPPEYRDVH